MWVPFIGHLAAFPPANMVVKSRSTGGAATKGKNRKKVLGYNQEVIPICMIKNNFRPSFVAQIPQLKDISKIVPKTALKAIGCHFGCGYEGDLE